MKVFKRGGFIILDDAGVESPVPIANFDYQIISGVVKMRDVAEQIGYSSLVTSLQDEFGVPVGNATAIATYFATLTASASGGGDASAANQLLEIAELQAINTNITGTATEVTLASIDAKVSTATKQDLQTTELQAINASTTKSNYSKLLTQANDLVQTYTWLDGGTADQRISTIVYSSATLVLTVTETFTYNGGAGTYHVATSTLS